MNEIRLSLSAAREDDSQPLHIATEGSLNQLPTKHRKGWTPAPTKPAYSQTNVSLEHKGRDYDAILRAAKRKPVGYWEDAPRGMKFGGGGEKAKCSAEYSASQPAAPTADGPWPKWEMFIASGGPHKGQEYVRRSDGPSSGRSFFQRGVSCAWNTIAPSCGTLTRTQAEIAQWLEQNGHEDVAAQLRGKAATARAWKCIDGWLRCNVGAKSFIRHQNQRWVREPMFDAGGVVRLITGNSDYTELHGPERDAIIAECCAAMKLDPTTGEPLHA